MDSAATGEWKVKRNVMWEVKEIVVVQRNAFSYLEPTAGLSHYSFHQYLPPLIPCARHAQGDQWPLEFK